MGFETVQLSFEFDLIKVGGVTEIGRGYKNWVESQKIGGVAGWNRAELLVFKWNFKN